MLDKIRRWIGSLFSSGASRRTFESLSKLKTDPTNEDLLDQVHELINKLGVDFYKSVLARFPAAAGKQEDLAAIEAPAVSGEGGVARQTWKNCIANQRVQPLKYFKPASLDELRSIIQQAALNHCRVKAIGSGHSFSDVAVTSDFLVDTHGLNRPLELEVDLMRDPSEASRLFKTECGIAIRDLNTALDKAGLALMNMGGWDQQTIVGAVSTSTHGSGVTLGPLSSAVVSLVLVSADGKLYQIEPANGITDPLRFNARHSDIELKQDDDWFHSTAVSLGCMGIIYSVTLRVTQKYWLRETRKLSTWDAVKNDLEEGRVLTDNRHYEVLVNPYEVKGRRACLVTKRNFDREPTEPILSRPHRNMFADLAAQLPGTSEVLLFLCNEFPHLIPRIIDSAMEQLEDAGYVDVSYKIFNLGGANLINGYSSEIGFPMSTYLAAVEEILAIAERNRALGDAYHTAPFSLRFVRASEDYMSMQYSADPGMATCMIEIPMLNGTIGGEETLRRYETAMYKFGGRPHWGQMNFVTGNHDLIRSMYPKYDAWLSVFKQLNASGMFDNSFTERCGFSESRFVRE